MSAPWLYLINEGELAFKDYSETDLQGMTHSWLASRSKMREVGSLRASR